MDKLLIIDAEMKTYCCRVVFDAEGRRVFEVIEEKEERVGIARQPYLRCGDRRKQRERHAIASHWSDSPSVRRNSIERRQRSRFVTRVPVDDAAATPTSRTRIDADPSCRITRSTPLVRTIDATATGRATAMIVLATARIRHSHQTRSPRSGSRSVVDRRPGRWRCLRI